MARTRANRQRTLTTTYSWRPTLHRRSHSRCPWPSWLARPYLIAYLGDEDRADRYLDQKQAHFACVGYPRTLEDRAHVLCDSVLPVDDTFSKPGIQGNPAAAREHHAGWSAVFAGEPPPPGADPAYFFVHEALEACLPHASPGLVERLRSGWQDVADAFLDEAIHKTSEVGAVLTGAGAPGRPASPSCSARSRG
ncbi:terpene synthase family protein [Nannocystis sp. ILAH1]|uniref:terpene synthase family protein n=1 Tax=unclassified Nannocystis TaxID=2627009 RepID=UPI00226DBAD5|nr:MULTISPECIES: terpene synthase family protein [unclassified Nannocystis]MCY0992207.1 terpene synthase family protein [Nannocystis sp. ILAH1]MCY1069203.1 terpene synthase family protein [Nannocystis sp. RBIL2]